VVAEPLVTLRPRYGNRMTPITGGGASADMQSIPTAVNRVR
jgi:hypothetical protein